MKQHRKRLYRWKKHTSNKGELLILFYVFHTLSNSRTLMKSAGLLFLFILLPFAGFSQGFNAGLIAGINASQVDGDRQAGYHKIGPICGGFVIRKLSPKLSWKMEMVYIQKGSKLVPNIEKNHWDYKLIKLDYVEVPVLFYLWWEKFKLNLELGLSFGALIASKEEYNHVETVLVGPYRDFEVAVVAGGNFPINEKLSASLRYSYSILPIANQALVTVWKTYGGSYNNIVELSISYKLLKSKGSE